MNFSVFSKHATGVELLLFDRVDDAQAARVIRLDPAANRTYHYWHVFVPGVTAGQIYGYRVEGPLDPASGMRFDPTKVLLDPYGRGVVVPDGYSRDAAREAGDNSATAMKSVVVDPSAYDWEGDAPLRRPSAQTIIYEMHVRGFTRHPSSGVGEKTRGTFAGLIEKIPYLQQLGITAVELLPVFQFDAQDCPPGKVNYWGYAPVSFFAPHQAYSSRQDPLGPVDEFRDMVKALHRAGIEVILDVVFNHTAEGDQRGPTLCFRGVDNTTYYILEDDRSRYANYTGTGNTLNANHPDRPPDDRGQPPLLGGGDARGRLPVRSRVDPGARRVGPAAAEPAGPVGHRDRIRCSRARSSSPRRGTRPASTRSAASSATAGRSGTAGSATMSAPSSAASRARWRGWRTGWSAAPRSTGTRNARPSRASTSSPVTTASPSTTSSPTTDKHNEANGEDNRDGANDNRSWNCGVEGPTDDPAVERLRNRQVKNFLTVTLLSLGMPMILMGDEVRRTQFGNNNAYCQDNEISWFDWTLVEKHADVHRFVTLLNARRLLRDVEHERRRVSLNQLIRQASKTWHGVKLGQPDWGDHSHSLAFEAELRQEGLRVYLILNAYWEPLDFELPPVGDGGAARGADGSTPRSNRRRTSSRGRRRPRCPAAPIGRRRAPSSYCLKDREGQCSPDGRSWCKNHPDVLVNHRFIRSQAMRITP